MQNSEATLASAQHRALEQRHEYAGVLTPLEVFDVLQQNPQAVLVDVRTQAELDLVGRVPHAVHVEWAFYPGMVANPAFAQQLAEKINPNSVVIFMCRTGGRSHNAATLAATLGYQHAYNMLEGFEGESNALKQRTLINGWKHAGLPWTN